MLPTSLWHPEAEVSQISLQLIRVRSLSREAEAAFEPGDTTDISVFSTQLLETAQEKIQNARHCPRSLPLTGFLPITPCYSKVILPCLRAAASLCLVFQRLKQRLAFLVTFGTTSHI